jgi:hypothetical protein
MEEQSTLTIVRILHEIWHKLSEHVIKSKPYGHFFLDHLANSSYYYFPALP